jgi:hypothetical protein
MTLARLLIERAADPAAVVAMTAADLYPPRTDPYLADMIKWFHQNLGPPRSRPDSTAWAMSSSSTS